MIVEYMFFIVQIAGVVCHFNIFYVKRWLTVPRAISSVYSRIFGNLFHSPAPDNAEGLQGATLEIQRQIRMDELDQQMWNVQQMNVTRRWPVSIHRDHCLQPADVFKKIY